MDPLADALCGAPKWLKSSLEKLSEMGYEQHSERGIGRRKEAKMGRKVPLRCSVRLHRRLLRPFSDSLGRRILRSWTSALRSSEKVTNSSLIVSLCATH